MSRIGRSARTREQRLARRRADVQGFDRGGGRRSIFRSRYAKIFYVVGLVGLMGSLLPLLLLGGNGHGGADSASSAGNSAIRRLDDLDVAGIGAVDKPSYDAPPAADLDPTQDYVAVFELESGTVRIQLFDDVAPIHANNFVFLIEEGFYDGLTFYRVFEGEVAQTGDPSATGNGDAGYVLPDEGAPSLDEPLTLGDQGLIAMARTGAETSSSQFFITLSPQEQLDGLGFVPFGRVVEGLELVLALTPRNPLTTPPPEAGDRLD
jgi:peptidyl-prolyl cis-trans isomerase B (cyclophilin B)